MPAAVLLLGYFVFSWNHTRFLPLLSFIVFNIFEIVALFFVGMWIKECVMSAQATPINEDAVFMRSEQNIMIKGISSKNLTALITIIVGVILLMVGSSVAYWEYKSVEMIFGVLYKTSDFYDNFLDFYFSACFSGRYSSFCMSALGTGALINGIYMNIRKLGISEIAVTNETILWKTFFGKNVTIPLNQVMAINPRISNGISIMVIRYGKINIYFIENQEDIIKTISDLLANRKNWNTQSNQPGSLQIKNNNEVEQLKIIKELLDSKILTQEEYDEKKKKILGM